MTRVLVALALLSGVWPALGQDSALSVECGSLQNAFGPFDYANAVDRRDHLPIVEEHHINSDVVGLRRGMSGENPRGDLEYVLRAFPNHHIALDAMARLHRKEHKEMLPGAPYSMTCWFDRARRMNPSDAMVPLIYGIHLFALKRYDDAEREMLEAEHLAPESAEIHYNLGLLYVRRNDYVKAQQHADKAYSLGFPLPGLREQLARRR